MVSDPADIESVKAANQRFYEAFGTLDIREMEEVWEASDRDMCVHPGWQPLVGWESVRASWGRDFRQHYPHALQHPLHKCCGAWGFGLGYLYGEH